MLGGLVVLVAAMLPASVIASLLLLGPIVVRPDGILAGLTLAVCVATGVMWTLRRSPPSQTPPPSDRDDATVPDPTRPTRGARP